MAVYGGPDIVTDGLVLHLDAANDKSYDPIVEDCSLVLNMEGSNGSTTFTDGSKYGHTVTANGNAQISTGNSRFGASSAYFDGNGDYLTSSSNSVFNFSSDFTVEAWVYISGNSSGDGNGNRIAGIVGNKIGGGDGWYLNILGNSTTTGTGIVFFGTVSDIQVRAEFSISHSSWHHIAVCRKGSVTKLFFNGVSQTLSVNSLSTTSLGTGGSLYVGSNFSFAPSFPRYFNGYIDSLRVIKGKALYTENFTPPKKSFPEYKWEDLSGNDNNGTFVNGVSYGSSNYGVMSFDGSNDYSENSSPNLGISGNLSATLSCWFYDTRSSTSTFQSLFLYGNTCSAGDTIAIGLRDLGFSAQYNGGNGTFSNNSIYSLNSWNNVVITKTPGAANTTTKLYLNGIQQSIASSTSITPNVVSRVIRVGRWVCDGFPYYFQGKVSNCFLYNRALTAQEVLQNYNATKGRYGL